MKTKDFGSILELLEALPDEQSCIDYFEEMRWNGNVVSPFDPDSKVYKCKGNKYRCRNTGKYFNAFTHTIMEGTKVSIRKWFVAIWLLTSGKKGISSYQLARQVGVTQKTAWFMSQRIRMCFADEETILEGEVEMDETFVGGKNKNRHRDKKVPLSKGRAHVDKTPVLGIVERGGMLIGQVIPDTSRKSITPVVVRRVSLDAIVYTDEWNGYEQVGQLYHREFVDHGHGQYVNGNVTTNRIEGFWSILKRGIIGVYQMATRKHLQRYVNEFVFRYNTRHLKDGERFRLFFSNFEQRLTYKMLVYG